MTNEVTINLNMFSTFMEDIIMSNFNSTSIITMKFNCSGTVNTKCKTRENSNFLKNGKIVILVKIRNLFSRSRMTKRISPLELSHEI